MPRSYKTKTPRDPNREIRIEEALKLHAEGASIRRAAKDTGVSDASLRHRLAAEQKGQTLMSRGNQTSLPEESERSLSAVLTLKSKWGFACNRAEVKQLVFDYVQKNKDLDTDIGKYLRKYCRFKVGSYPKWSDLNRVGLL